MSLFALLQQSAMSMQAQTAYSSTVAHNLANANTPGFARQRAELSAVTLPDRIGGSYIGRGAMLQAVTQARDRFVEAQLPAALGNQSHSAAELSAIEGINALNPEDGLVTALGDFYAQMRALAQNPGNHSYREAAVGAARSLGLAFNRTATALESARTGLDARIEGRLPEVNETAAQIARLNVEVRNARATGGNPNDLLDSRQKLADRLSELTGAVPVGNSDGDMNLVLANGQALVSANHAASFSTQPNVADRNHLQLMLRAADGTGPTVLAAPIGGEIGGMVSARDNAIKSAETRVDQLAFDLAGVVNGVHNTGYALDGSTGRDLFTISTTVEGAAKAMAVNTTIAANTSLLATAGSATGGTGDATSIQALVATEHTALGGSGADPAGTLAGITSGFGATAERLRASSAGDEALLGNLTALRQSASSVSVDEELVNMQKAQRAYEAVTQVIKTADLMLETLMSLR